MVVVCVFSHNHNHARFSVVICVVPNVYRREFFATTLICAGFELVHHGNPHFMGLPGPITAHPGGRRP